MIPESCAGAVDGNTKDGVEGEAFGISVNKVGFFLCFQCSYLTQETGALQGSCDCLPCSHLSIRLCHGTWATAPGREQHHQEKKEPRSHGFSAKHLGCPVPTVLSAPAMDQVMSARPFCGSWTPPPPWVDGKRCASSLFPCGAGVLQLCGQAVCRDGAGYSFPEPCKGSFCCPCVEQVHQNI